MTAGDRPGEARAGVIRTARLRLEPLVPDHADALFEGLHDSLIHKYIDAAPPASAAALRARFEALAAGRSPDGRQLWLNWAAWSLTEGRFVGHLQATLDQGTAE